MRKTNGNIDLSGIDLFALIGQDTQLKKEASTNGGEYSGPCPFCGGTDRFNVWPNHPDGKGKWWCRQCNRSGDALDYLEERDGLSFSEACDQLRVDATHLAMGSREAPGKNGHRELADVQVPYRKLKPPTWDDEAAQKVLERCRKALWSEAGARAIRWLNERGLRDDTIQLFQLGYNSRDQELFGLWVPRGIVIPAFRKDRLWYLKVRRPVAKAQGDKYGQVKGGGRLALFGAESLSGKSVAVVCEGEFDAMLLYQEAGDLVDVVAIGSAQTRPALLGVGPLAKAIRWLIALDADSAGEKGAEWWDEFSARTRRIRPPEGKDLTDFHIAGGDLRAWVSDHLDQLGIETRPACESGTEAAGSYEQAAKQAESLEQKAEQLLKRCDGSAEWAEQWAALAQEADWPCYGMSWSGWVEAVAAPAPI